jgi:hypothetical protein
MRRPDEVTIIPEGSRYQPGTLMGVGPGRCGCVLPRRPQPIEKVSIELEAFTNRASIALKAAHLVPDLGLKRLQRVFFNSLADYQNVSW